HGDLITVGTYESIEFKFDFTISHGANSGVKYLVMAPQRDGDQSIGLEYQIADDSLHPDAKEGKDGNRTAGSLYDLVPSRKSPQHIRPVGEWNQGMIRMLPDGRVEHWYNAQ